MELKKIILFVFAIVAAQLIFAAKDGYYGNIKLRSIGVGNMPQTERGYQVTLQNNTNSSYMHYYGRQADNQNYSTQMTHNYTALRVNTPASISNQPFEGDVVTTGNAMYAFPELPKDPGSVPVGDAMPFVVLLALGYIYLRSRE